MRMKRYVLFTAALALAGGVAGVAAADSGPLADARLDLLVEAGVGEWAGVGGGDPGDAAREREGGDE